MTPEQEQYLRERNLAVLATGRKDGSPQVSTIYYDYDGTDIVVSVTTDRAKWVNTQRQPRVAMVVNDGRRQMIIYGTTEGVRDDPARLDANKRLRNNRNAEYPDDATFVQQLDEAHRVILRITPDQVHMND